MTNTRRPDPDWNLWRKIPTVKAWEAVALSLSLEPKAVKYVDLKRANAVRALRDDKIGLMARQQALLDDGPAYRFHESPEFNERLEVTIRNGEALPTVGASPADDYAADRTVRLSQFATLASSLGWEIPVELKELENPAGGKADRVLADIQAAYNAARAKKGKAPSQYAVAEESGYDRGTVRSRWSDVQK
jgi:hypothetical protein